MNEYQGFYESRFVRNLTRYSGLRQCIQRKIEQIFKDPYTGTERLGQVTGGLDLRGCRSACIDRNFRVIFVICEECRHINEYQFCFCEEREDETVVFLTVGPHDRAYALR